MARSFRELAHDLNNALLPLRAYGELALRKIDRGDDPREEVEQMLAAAANAGRIVDELRGESRRRRVLVLEDDETVRESILRLLEMSGYEAVPAADLEQAAAAGRVDLVLADLSVRATRERISEICPGAPAIFMSGSVPPDGIPPERFLAKPFGLQELEDAVAGALR
ncbi:MAG: hypothetical protein JOY72_10865 [Actinobacteria bacterium]|nr:hypothetical protein [Actinomycetota bacterium]